MKRKLLTFAAVGILAALSLGSPLGATPAAKSLIQIHESGTINELKSDVQGAVKGKFTIELKLSPFGPAGTTAIYAVPATTRVVNGQQQIPFTATDNMTSKGGTLVIAVKGIHFDVNPKTTPSADQFGPAAEYGTWKIRSATGIYEGWKGGGNWASVSYGYKKIEPYSVEWDGYVTP